MPLKRPALGFMLAGLLFLNGAPAGTLVASDDPQEKPKS